MEFTQISAGRTKKERKTLSNVSSHDILFEKFSDKLKIWQLHHHFTRLFYINEKNQTLCAFHGLLESISLTFDPHWSSLLTITHTHTHVHNSCHC